MIDANPAECAMNMLTEHSDVIIVITQKQDEPPVIRLSGSVYAMPLLLDEAYGFVAEVIRDGKKQG